MMYLLALIIMAGLWVCGYAIGHERGVRHRGDYRLRRNKPAFTANDEWPEYRPLERRR